MKAILSVILEIARAAALMLALACASVALAAQGGRFSDRLDVLTHFTPIWFAGALVAVVVWLFTGRQSRTTPVLALAAVLSTLTLMLPELQAAWGQKREPEAAPALTVIQFNVWGSNGDDARIAAWLLEQDADVLLIEEVSGQIYMALREKYPYVVTCADREFCSSMIFSRRRPIAQGGLQTTASGADLPGAWATFDGRGGAFTAVNVHYVWPYPAGPQQQQAVRLAKALEPFPRESLVLTGDFNSTPWSFSLRRQDRMFGLERRTRALPSWPATELSRLKIPVLFPVLPIDHVYAGEGWRTVSVTRGPRLGSDHFPIVVKLARR